MFHSLLSRIVGSLMLAPAALGAIGFTSAGITAGSSAAGMMSGAAVANGGGVAAGSLVSVLQSAGKSSLDLWVSLCLEIWTDPISSVYRLCPDCRLHFCYRMVCQSRSLHPTAVTELLKSKSEVPPN